MLDFGCGPATGAPKPLHRAVPCALRKGGKLLSGLLRALTRGGRHRLGLLLPRCQGHVNLPDVSVCQASRCAHAQSCPCAGAVELQHACTTVRTHRAAANACDGQALGAGGPAGAGGTQGWRAHGRMRGMTETLTARLQTNLGTIVVRLFPYHAPKPVRNFTELADGPLDVSHPPTVQKT